MSAVARELLQLARQVCNTIEIPAVQQVYIPEPNPSPDRDSEFGIVVLEDNSAGLYYAWMGSDQSGMNERYADLSFGGMPALALAELYGETHQADRSLGLAAIGAISQSVFRRAGMSLDTAADSMGELKLVHGDHLGMVGYFPSLVRKLLAEGMQLTVIERKEHLLQQQPGLHMSQDIEALQSCNKILSTASTLLNDSVDEVLDCCQSAQTIVMVGPTAGFFPDPLFARGVKALGGTSLKDVTGAIERCRNDQGLRDTARKYLLQRDSYPGLQTLLDKIN